MSQSIDEFRITIHKIISMSLKKDDQKKNIDLKNIDLLLNKNINIINIIKLYYGDYLIFLAGTFFKKGILSKIGNYVNISSNKLLKYFDKYEFVYFNYLEKNQIMCVIEIINNFIRYSNNKIKRYLLKELEKIDSLKFILKKKMKEIYIYENNIEPNILYKKIQFSDKELYMPFENYAIKKIEYKLRTFSQIAEKLGAEKIVIKYNKNTNNKNSFNMSLDMFEGAFGTEVNTENHQSDNIEIIFEYPNNNYGINLNKFYIIDSILNENEFLITRDEFERDLELKFLIDARCINFIQKYHTNFIINYMNTIEQKIFLKAEQYGLSIGNLNMKNNITKIFINIDFIQLNTNFSMIDGTNIHVLREGFVYLSNIIKLENLESSYGKLLGFLKSHLTAIQNKWISLPYTYDYIYDINSIYNTILNVNMTENEAVVLIKSYFQNNLNWDTFLKFRDLTLRGSDSGYEKIHFITFQFYDILKYKKIILSNISKYIDIEITNFITTIDNLRSKNNFDNLKNLSFFKKNNNSNNSNNITDENKNNKNKNIYKNNNDKVDLMSEIDYNNEDEDENEKNTDIDILDLNNIRNSFRKSKLTMNIADENITSTKTDNIINSNNNNLQIA